MPARILIVEDEGVIALDLRCRLEALGYEIVGIADTGDGAIRLAAATVPDLVLMDVRLKGPMDGVTAAGLIRETSPIPVIFLTAYSDADTLRRAGAADGSAYLHKPCQDRDLRSGVEMALAKHRAEAALRASQRAYAATVQSLPDALIGVGPDGRVTLFNEAAERLTGWPADDAVGRLATAVLPLVDERTRESVVDLTRAAGDFLMNRRDGTAVVVEVSVGRAGETAVIAVRDATARRAAEEWVRRQQKFECLGVMAAGVAHDFNNLLVPILGFAELAIRSLPADSPVGPMVKEILAAGLRARGVTRQMLDFIEKAPRSTAEVNLSSAVAATAAVFGAGLPEGTLLVSDLAATVPPLRGDPLQLGQLAVNLILNAREALPAGRGQVVVRTASREIRAADVAAFIGTAPLVPGPHVALTVTDDGGGMSPETQARIFDPFFTTKFAGRGLGLAVAFGIVRRHHGGIRVTSVPGRGTTVEVAFPVAARPVSAPVVSAPATVAIPVSA